MKSMIYMMVPWAVMFLAVSSWFKPVTASEVAADKISRSFNVEPNGLLVINSNLGSIEVVAGDANHVDIEVGLRAETKGGKSAEAVLRSIKIDFQQSGNTITVVSDAPRTMRLDVGFKIRIPSAYNLNLKTSGGGIGIKGASGDIQCRTSGGGLEFENVHGTITGDCSGGGIRVTGASGTVNARASGGGIQISNLDGALKGNASGGSIDVMQSSGNLEVSCAGGGINLERFRGAVQASSSGGGVSALFAGRPTGDCRLTSSGGDVVVYLPNETNFSLDSEVKGGRVETEFNLSAIGAQSQHSIKGDVNGGGPKLFCKANGGNVYLKKL